MIRNNDVVGSYLVRVFASRNCVASFQCATLDDAKTEVARIRDERTARGLQTSKAMAQKIVKAGRRGRKFLGQETSLDGPADTDESFISDGILIYRAEFLVCDPCVKLEGQECHTPECVFCFQPVSVARAVLNKTLNCPIIDGERLILLGNAPRIGVQHST